MFDRFKLNVDAVKKNDPSAKSILEIILLYPGLHAIQIHYFSHWLYKNRMYFISRLISTLVRNFIGIEIHPGAKLGKGIFIDHGTGLVIGSTVEIGDGCLIYHGVTLGSVNLKAEKRHPSVGKNVIIGCGAKVLGNIYIGDNCKIGSNAVVLESIPDNCTVVGVPARIIKKS